MHEYGIDLSRQVWRAERDYLYQNATHLKD